MAKFCSKCGSRLDDGSLFCAECGTPVNNTNYMPAQQGVQAPQNNNYQAAAAVHKKSKAPVIVVIIILVIAICAGVGIYLYNDYNSPQSRLKRSREAVKHTAVYTYKGCSVTAMADMEKKSDNYYEYTQCSKYTDIDLSIAVYDKDDDINSDYNDTLWKEILYMHGHSDEVEWNDNKDDEFVKTVLYFNGVNYLVEARSIRKNNKRYRIEFRCDENYRSVYESYIDKWIKNVKIK